MSSRVYTVGLVAISYIYMCSLRALVVTLERSSFRKAFHMETSEVLGLFEIDKREPTRATTLNLLAMTTSIPCVTLNKLAQKWAA